MSDPAIQQFYTNPKIIESFKTFITKLLTHVNKYTNLTYAEDPTIFAFESGNELLGPIWGDMDCPTSWVTEIARHVKSLAPKKMFVDGTYGVNRTHLAIEEVDIFSNHYYPISISQLQTDLATLAKVNKPYFAGEYDWIGQSQGGDPLADWYRIIENTPGALGDTFWSLFGRNVPNCDVSDTAALARNDYVQFHLFRLNTVLIRHSP
jgi:mannan endo-1,4-beta-mannosidase